VTSFVDTNILVYAEDEDEKDKHPIARDLVVELWRTREGVVSVQVLQEFFVTVTRKIKRPLPVGRAQDIVREYLTWRVVDNTGALLVSAIDLHQKARLSFWDAMVVQAAINAGCEQLYSEDLNDGQLFGTLKVVSPFSRIKRKRPRPG
jgi:predicted nucleic acid-binding protein